MAKLRAAVITDAHYGFDIKDKLGSKAPKLMEHFAKAVNKFDPDVVIDMGDRVSAKSAESDRHYMQEYRKHFNDIAARYECVVGNHDIKNLSRGENEEIMDRPATSYSKDIGGYHLVFWSPKVLIDDDGIDIHDEDFDWLRDDLAATDKKVIMFSHVPLDNLDGEELNPYTRYFFWTQGEQVRQILEDAGNVVLCMAGHRHRNRHREINGINYITQQSLTSTWKKHYRVPSRTYSFLEADDDKITIDLQGKTNKTYEIPVGPSS